MPALRSSYALTWRMLLTLIALLPPANAAAAPTSLLPELDPASRARIALAAEDAALPSWQREVMRDVAGTRATSLGDGVWSEVFVFGTPERRYDAGTMYDPLRKRMIVFGGYDLGGRNDVWALALAGTPQWTRLQTFNAPPAERHGHRATYDRVRDRMLVFGGATSGGQLCNDVWALTLTEPHLWKELTPSGSPPTARCLHGQAYDSRRDRLLVFGGYSSFGARNDLWALSLGETPAWGQILLGGAVPEGRYGLSMLLDEGRDRLVLFGGWGSGMTFDDTWTLSLNPMAWSQLSPSGAAPTPRALHTAVFDTARDRMVVRGGNNGSALLDETWALSFASTPSWTDITPAAGSTPGARGSESAVYDPVGDRLVTFGGQSAAGIEGDTWELPFTGTPQWNPLVGFPPSPAPRSQHSAVLDPLRDRLIVFGGNWGGDYDDLWSLSLAGTPTWGPLLAGGTPPGARYDHSAIYDPVRDRMIVFGGMSNGFRMNDVWELSLSRAPSWSALMPAGPPPSPRYQHDAVYDAVHDRMIVFCGLDATGDRSDTWALSLSGAPAWTELAPTGAAPAARHQSSAIADPARDRMIVFGGLGLGYLSDVWQLSLGDTLAWALLAPTGAAPPGMYGHTAVLDPDRDRMVVFGGHSLGAYSNDTWAMSLSGAPAWTKLQPPGSRPSGRIDHPAVYDPTRELIWVYGGFNGGRLNDVWTFTPLVPVGIETPPFESHMSELRAIAPNPARGDATVSFAIARPGRVRLAVIDVSGRLVRTLLDEVRPAGAGQVTWDGMSDSGARAGTGVYFVRLIAAGARSTRRVVLLR